MKNKTVSFEELYPLILEKIEGGYEFSFHAFGRSMLPFIHNGTDLVTLGPVVGPIEKNDVVFYRRDNGKFILHRVIRVRKNSFDLCGDNQYCVEKGIRKDQILAKLVRLERDGKEIDTKSAKATLFCALLPARRFMIHLISFLRNRLGRQ